MAEPLSIGAAIYISIKPMIKIFLNAGIGFYLARQNIFTIEFCQKMSVAIVNVLSPCLVFSRIVSTIDVGQMRTIGVIVLIGFVYQLLGLVVGMVLNRTTPVPKNWRGGMLIAGMLNNAGDLPVAYVTTLAQGSLFSANDGARGTSYAIAFMFCFTICLFNFGGYRLIENDFKDRLCVPQDEESQTEGDGTSNDTPEKHTEKSDDKISTKSSNAQPAIDSGKATGVNTNSENAISSDSDDNEEIAPIYGQHGYASRRHNSNASSRSKYNNDNNKSVEGASQPRSSRASFTSSMKSVTPAVSIPTAGMLNPHANLAHKQSLTRSRRTSVGGCDSNEAAQITDLPLTKTFSGSNLVDDLNSLARLRPSETIDDVVDNYSQFDIIRKINSIQQQQQQKEGLLRNRLQPQNSEIHSFSGQLSLNEEVLGNSTSASLNMVTSSKSSAKDTGFKGRTLNYIRSIKDNSKSSKEILAILRGYLWQLGVNFLRPPSLALIIAVVITIIKPVRRLFYDDHSTSSIPNAPDGLPVLSFVMDLTNFIGNAAVPCGLCMLGATLSRLKITALPKGFWKSLFAMSLFKLVILPIIGILIVTRMMTIGWISKDNYMAIFVIIVSAGTPGSTSQIYITALYTPPGDNHDELDWVSAMLILQYCVLIFTLTVVVTYTLKNIVGF